jgi:cytochrome c biogenesis protein CcdA
MRRFFCLTLVIIMALALFPKALAQSKPELLYFFESYCGSCTPEEDFIEEFRKMTGKSTGDYDCKFYNIRYENAKEALDSAIDAYNIPKEKQLLPLLIVDGEIYAGKDAISVELPKDTLSREDTTDSIIYYLYVTACGSCAEAKKTLDTLPASVSISRGTYTFDSKVVIVPINIGEETAMALSLFESYQVPEDKQFAPIVFLRDRYLSGSEEIARELDASLLRGEAVGNRIAQPDMQPLPPLRLLSTFAAGLIGGLNPCALSMVLLFLSILIPLKKKAGRYAVLFLVSKFVCYLAIGTLLTGVMQYLDLSWLPLAIKIFLTVYSVVLITLNLWDAYAAKREEYGHIRNQLPARLRRFIHKRIEGIATSSKALIPAVLLLGILVAASEFLCAGQVYLATLLTSLQSGIDSFRLFLLLVAYCLAFLVPSALVSILILRGKAALQLSDFVRRRMAAIKLVTALFFIAVLLAVWLL